MQIESYRTRLEEFEQNLNRELFRYYSGQKSRLEILSAYSDYADLFSAWSIREVEAELKKTSESFASRKKSLQKIHRFLIDQYLDSRTAPLTQESALFEAKQTLVWEGMDVGLSQVPGLLKNEPDAARRRKLSELHVRALGKSELRQKRVVQLNSAAVGLEFRNYTQARELINGTDYKQLLKSFDGVLDRLEDRYLEQLRVSFESTLGFPFSEAGSWDVAYWRKKNDPLHIFSQRHLLPVIEMTISEFGIQPEHSDAVTFDLESRASKKPGSFCIPIRIPQEVKVVMQPEDGSGSYAALLHESGHALHFAWTSSSLPVEYRIWGDRALSESYAFLFENCILDPKWLAHVLFFTESEEFLRFQYLLRVFLVRRCAGRLCFSMRLHEQESGADMPQVYAETMKAYTGVQHLPGSWLEELPDGFEAADCLRGWALESMLRDYLRSKYGRTWFLNRSSAGFLKEIWETGQLYNADELCREIGIGGLDPQVLADELSEGLR